MDRRDGCSTEPLSFERIPEMEDKWRKEITAMTVELQDKRKSIQNDEILRGVHPKSHGCLDAEFTVNCDISAELQVGLFAHPGKCFQAKIRYSNADVLKRADLEKGHDPTGARLLKHGSRGMAIKVLDVGEPVLLDDGCAQNQDFLMVNTPEFAFRNVRDYRRLTQALCASADGADPLLFFLPGELLKRGMMDMSGNLLPAPANEPPQNAGLRALFETNSDFFAEFAEEDMQGVISAAAVVGKIQATPVRNPLFAPYFSAAPFRFGNDRVMRFSVVPINSDAMASQADISAFENFGDDYLSQALALSLADNDPIKLSFRVQVAQSEDIKNDIDGMIENAARAWDEDQFTHTEVAQVTINPQCQPTELVDTCKPLLFTPWHAVVDFEPLGGINRLRKPVYSTSAAFRRSV
ncbi:catalase family protein [Roseobacter litoralis]|uniref:catalase family protein n=1 Tax=Roseobacter litoralis TaxID=42443 RepID=UPI002495A319|nr:catalase family protein [Roseobacter litoralis]